MALFFVAAFWIGMYVVIPLMIAWIIWSGFGVANGHAKVLIWVVSLIIVSDYWETERQHSPRPLPSANVRAYAVGAAR